jgi:alpha-tubulin suppressor-like RCC1 family protein
LCPVDVIDPGDPSGFLTNVSSVDSASHTLAVKGDGTVRAWGPGTLGQLGDGLGSNSLVPVQTSNLYWVLEVSAGGSHSLALKGDGTVWAWGPNGQGQIGDGTDPFVPTPVSVVFPD